jgi:predicted RNA-binding protein
MCEAHAFMLKKDKEEMVMKNVDLLEVEGDEIRMTNIFGEQTKLKARIKRYDASKSRIMLEAIE